MRTAEEIATDVMLSIDDMRPPHGWCVERVAEAIRAARIEAVEEFRERARGECYDDGGESGWLAHTIAKRIAALPALPEEP